MMVRALGRVFHWWTGWARPVICCSLIFLERLSFWAFDTHQRHSKSSWAKLPAARLLAICIVYGRDPGRLGFASSSAALLHFSLPTLHEFHETCHSVIFYFLKKDSKRCCNTTTPESIHTKDESKRGSAFAFIFGVNWPIQWMWRKDKFHRIHVQSSYTI